MQSLAGIKILHPPSHVSTDIQSQGAAQRCTVLCRGTWERAWVLLLPGRSYTHLPVVLPPPPSALQSAGEWTRQLIDLEYDYCPSRPGQNGHM